MPKTDIRSISMSNFEANKIKMSFDLPSGSKMRCVLKSSDISRYRIKDFGQVNMVADDYWDRSVINQTSQTESPLSRYVNSAQRLPDPSMQFPDGGDINNNRGNSGGEGNGSGGDGWNNGDGGNH